MQKFNIFDPAFDHSSDREGYRWQGARVGKAIGGDEIGACLYQLAAGERTYPYHLHHGNEEWLFVPPGRRRCGHRTASGRCAPAT